MLTTPNPIESEIEEHLRNRGIRMLGIARAGQLPSVPAPFSPQAMLKEAKSVICYGVPVPKGVLYAESDALALYWRYCNMVYRSLDMATNELCVLLEEKGYLASPIYGCYPWKIVDREFWGLLPLVFWAEQAGLGKLTRCGLLAHPRYGTRILLAGVVTSSSLQPNEKMAGQVCPEACRLCLGACPANAIDETGKVSHNACIRHSGANPLLALVLRDSVLKDKFPFETIVNTVGVDDHGAYTCFKCVEVCPLNQ